jgi:hypothetical protein
VVQQQAGSVGSQDREFVMKTFIAVATALAALTIAGAAGASERGHAGRHVQQQGIGSRADVRDSYDYYPGWGRDPVQMRGVYPGLIYGGAISAPAGR